MGVWEYTSSNGVSFRVEADTVEEADDKAQAIQAVAPRQLGFEPDPNVASGQLSPLDIPGRIEAAQDPEAVKRFTRGARLANAAVTGGALGGIAAGPPGALAGAVTGGLGEFAGQQVEERIPEDAPAAVRIGAPIAADVVTSILAANPARGLNRLVARALPSFAPTAPARAASSIAREAISPDRQGDAIAALRREATSDLPGEATSTQVLARTTDPRVAPIAPGFEGSVQGRLSRDLGEEFTGPLVQRQGRNIDEIGAAEARLLAQGDPDAFLPRFRADYQKTRGIVNDAYEAARAAGDIGPVSLARTQELVAGLNTAQRGMVPGKVRKLLEDLGPASTLDEVEGLRTALGDAWSVATRAGAPARARILKNMIRSIDDGQDDILKAAREAGTETDGIRLLREARAARTQQGEFFENFGRRLETAETPEKALQGLLGNEPEFKRLVNGIIQRGDPDQLNDIRAATMGFILGPDMVRHTPRRALQLIGQNRANIQSLFPGNSGVVKQLQRLQRRRMRLGDITRGGAGTPLRAMQGATVNTAEALFEPTQTARRAGLGVLQDLLGERRALRVLAEAEFSPEIMARLIEDVPPGRAEEWFGTLIAPLFARQGIALGNDSQEQ